MGIPEYIKGKRRDLFRFVDTKLSTRVDRGFHAIALDEQRRDFPVTRWDSDPRIQQVWFIGCHSDVGGGYPKTECGLSDIALAWMAKNLQSLGVSFADEAVYPTHPDIRADVHQPWSAPPFDIGAAQRPPKEKDVYHPTVPERWRALATYQQLWPKGFAGCALCDEPSAVARLV